MIEPGTTAIDRSNAEIITVDHTPDGNKGLEGISYDGDGHHFYVVKEKNPRRIYQLAWPTAANNGAAPRQPWNIQEESLSLKDLSDIYHHPATGNLLMLSDESATVVETTRDGKERGRLFLKKSRSTGLIRDVRHAEGITMDGRGVLFICSEPNLLYLFTKSTGQAREIAPGL